MPMTAVAAATVKLAVAEKHKIAVPHRRIAFANSDLCRRSGPALMSQLARRVIDIPASIAVTKAHETGFGAAL